MRLIDADALEKQLHELALDKWNQGVVTSWSNAYLECEDIVYDAPTVDPIQHGQWNDKKVAFYRVCSECGAVISQDISSVYLLECMEKVGKLNYCPNCGAKMDEVKDET